MRSKPVVVTPGARDWRTIRDACWDRHVGGFESPALSGEVWSDLGDAANALSLEAEAPDIMLEEHTATSAAVERANMEMLRHLDIVRASFARADRCPTCNGYGTVDDPRCHADEHPPMDPPCCLPCPTCAV